MSHHAVFTDQELEEQDHTTSRQNEERYEHDAATNRFSRATTFRNSTRSRPSTFFTDLFSSTNALDSYQSEESRLSLELWACLNRAIGREAPMDQLRELLSKGADANVSIRAPRRPFSRDPAWRFRLDEPFPWVECDRTLVAAILHWPTSAQMIELLLESGADLHIPSKYFSSALSAAVLVWPSSQDVVTVLLSRGAEINPYSHIHSADGCRCWDPYNDLAKPSNGPAYLKKYKYLAENEQFQMTHRHANWISRTPLHVAVYKRSSSAVEFLISHGADPNIFDARVGSPLTVAIQEGMANIVELLLSNGATMYDDSSRKHLSKRSPLQLAMENHRADVFEILLREGANVNFPDPHGSQDTPLTASVWQPSTSYLKSLLERGADPNLSDGHGRRPLYHAALLGREDMVTMLLEAGAEVSDGGRLSSDVLHAATTSRTVPVIERLLDAGALFQNQVHRSGTAAYANALVAAAAYGSTRTFGMLLDCGIDPYPVYWRLCWVLMKQPEQIKLELRSQLERAIKARSSSPSRRRQTKRIAHHRRFVKTKCALTVMKLLCR